jgi:hypothetical protein
VPPFGEKNRRAKIFCTKSDEMGFFWKLIEAHPERDTIIHEFGYRMHYAISGIEPLLGWAETSKYHLKPLQKDISNILGRLSQKEISKKYRDDRRNAQAARIFAKNFHAIDAVEALERLQIYIADLAKEHSDKRSNTTESHTANRRPEKFAHFAPRKWGTNTSDRNLFIRIMHPFFARYFNDRASENSLALAQIFFANDMDLDLDTIAEQGGKLCAFDIPVEELMPGDYWDNPDEDFTHDS